MVGTIEPRKNHARALQAVERLWDRDIDVSLCIAGKQGWMVESLMETLQRHPELGRRLHGELVAVTLREGLHEHDARRRLGVPFDGGDPQRDLLGARLEHLPLDEEPSAVAEAETLAGAHP